MKILHLSIITGTIGVAVLVGIFTFFSQSPQNQSYPLKENYTIVNGLVIQGLNDMYEAGYPVSIDLQFQNNAPNCQVPSFQVKNLSDGKVVFGPTILQNYTSQHCTTDKQIRFYAGLEKNMLISNTQRYSIEATLYDKVYKKQFTVIPSQYSSKNITATEGILPGSIPFLSCQVIQGTGVTETVQSSSGFVKYHRYLDSGNFPEVDDYLLQPGHGGNIVLKIKKGSGLPTFENYATGILFLNSNSHYDNFKHSGVNVSYFPPIAIAGLDGMTTVSINISASSNATTGTYWVYLPPGGCVGGKLILLTIGYESLAQPPDLVGYTLPVDFSFGESPILTVAVFDYGIHTFENCTLTEVSSNRTSFIKNFDQIHPGFEYEYHFESNPPSGDHIVFGCKNPSLVKVYTSK